jgi:hypothetical protein
MTFRLHSCAPHAAHSFCIGPPVSIHISAEQDVTAAARDLVELVKHLTVVARDPRSAIFVMELFRGSPTARNKAAVSAMHVAAGLAVGPTDAITIAYIAAPDETGRT